MKQLATYSASSRTSAFFALNLLHTLLVVFVGFILVSACSKPEFVGSLPNENAEAISVSEAVALGNLDRTIAVAGKVAEVCQEEGCWMVITDGRSKLRMTFKDEAFLVPLTLSGRVIVEGVVSENIYDEESAKVIAESIGYARASIDSMHGDQRLPTMTATGVLFLDNK